MEDELTLEMLGNADYDPSNVPVGTDEGTALEDINETTEDLFPAPEVIDEIEGDTGDKTESPEGVSGEQEEGDTNPEEGDGKNSPNLYASIASSLQKDGILTLDDEVISEIKDPEKLAEAFKSQVQKLIDEKTSRVEKALEADLPQETIKSYENTLSYLSNLTEQDIKSETPEGEELREKLIYQDYINKGFSHERALKELDRIFKDGSDVEAAIDAKEDNLKHFNSQYQNMIKSGEEAKANILKEEKAKVKQIEAKILETEEPIKGLKLNKQDRQNLLNNFNKVVAKEDKTNRPLTAIQKYAVDYPIDYQFNLNLLFSLTNGFKDLSKLTNKQVGNQYKTKLADLEKTLKNTDKFDSGYSFGNSKDPESKSGIEVMFD